jgi:hypothetical protein
MRVRLPPPAPRFARTVACLALILRAPARSDGRRHSPIAARALGLGNDQLLLQGQSANNRVGVRGRTLRSLGLPCCPSARTTKRRSSNRSNMVAVRSEAHLAMDTFAKLTAAERKPYLEETATAVTCFTQPCSWNAWTGLPFSSALTVENQQNWFQMGQRVPDVRLCIADLTHNPSSR